jgi:hypothetical protein
MCSLVEDVIYRNVLLLTGAGRQLSLEHRPIPQHFSSVDGFAMAATAAPNRSMQARIFYSSDRQLNTQPAVQTAGDPASGGSLIPALAPVTKFFCEQRVQARVPRACPRRIECKLPAKTLTFRSHFCCRSKTCFAPRTPPQTASWAQMTQPRTQWPRSRMSLAHSVPRAFSKHPPEPATHQLTSTTAASSSYCHGPMRQSNYSTLELALTRKS